MGGEGAAKLVYVLYLAGFVTGGITNIIGLVVAYVARSDADEDVASPIRFQIRTFWIGRLYSIVGGLLSIIVVGIFVLLFAGIWLIVRCVKGFMALDKGERVVDEETWLF